MSDPTHSKEGGCLCGAVRYRIDGPILMTAVCHCTHCQRQSGSVLSFNVMVDEAHYHQQGSTKVYEDRGDSGKPVWRHFCGDCGSPILSRLGVRPGLLAVKGGTLDSLEGLKPAARLYCRHAPGWLDELGAVEGFAENPPSAEKRVDEG
jgi:hypothetical protein